MTTARLALVCLVLVPASCAPQNAAKPRPADPEAAAGAKRVVLHVQEMGKRLKLT
jgi:hypothetical protein